MRTSAGLLALLLLGASGCGNGPLQACDAIDFHDALVIHAPEGEVVSITTGGACAGARMRCNYGSLNPFIPGCETYEIEPATVGLCQLTISFKSLPESHIEVRIETNTGCNGAPYLGTAPDAGDIFVGDAGDVGDVGDVGDAGDVGDVGDVGDAGTDG